MNKSSDGPSTIPAHIQYELFTSSINNNLCSQCVSSSDSEQLIIYGAPVTQMQLSSNCKEIINRLKEIKKEKSLLIAVINPRTLKVSMKHHDDQQRQQ